MFEDSLFKGIEDSLRFRRVMGLLGLASGLGYSNEPFGSGLEGSEICTPRTLKPALPSAKARSTGRKVRPWLPCTSEMFKGSVSGLRGREFGFIAFGVARLLGCRLRSSDVGLLSRIETAKGTGLLESLGSSRLNRLRSPGSCYARDLHVFSTTSSLL